MTPNLQSFVDELTKTADDKKRTVIPNSTLKAPGAVLSESQARSQQHEPIRSKKTFIPNSVLKAPGANLSEDQASTQPVSSNPGPSKSPEGANRGAHGIHMRDRPGTISPDARVRRGRDIEFHGGSQYQVPPGFKGEVHPADEPKVHRPSKGPVPAGPKGKTVIPWKAFPPGQHYTETFKQASAGDVLRSLALRAVPGAAVGAGVGGVRGVGDEGAVSGAAKGALVGALLGIPMSHGADRLGAFAGKHLAAREVAKQIATKPYHKLTSVQRKALVDAIGEGAKPAQELVSHKLRQAGAIGAGVTGGVLGTREKNR